MKEASWYRKSEDGKLQCLLCPHSCILKDGQPGNCRVRVNQNGILYAENYGRVSAIHLDPIEKKPLYHFFPGKKILSVGTVGCNLHCVFCQNCEISQVSVAEAAFPDSMSAGQVASLAATTENNIGIAYTYNEPTIWFEYVIEVAQQVKSFGLKNVMVTNGFINPEPLAELMEFIDAFSIDLKSFDESFYRKQTASALPPVLDTLKTVKKAGKHLEVVNLVIPNLNDDPENFKDMIQWIASELGRETVLHLSAYYPCYRAKEPPTPAGLLLQFRDIASAFLDFVYTGNLPGENNNTICPVCGSILIERRGYLTAVQGLTTEGACKSCGRKIFQKN